MLFCLNLNLSGFMRFGVKFGSWNSGCVAFLTNYTSGIYQCSAPGQCPYCPCPFQHSLLPQDTCSLYESGFKYKQKCLGFPYPFSIFLNTLSFSSLVLSPLSFSTWPGRKLVYPSSEALSRIQDSIIGYTIKNHSLCYIHSKFMFSKPLKLSLNFSFIKPYCWFIL